MMMQASKSGAIEQRLRELDESLGGLPRVLQFYRDILVIEDRVGREAAVPEAVITAGSASECRSEGRPLLADGGLDLDGAAVGVAYREVKATFCRYPDLFHDMPAESETWPGEPVTEDSIREWLAGPDAGEVAPPAAEEDGERRLSRNVALAAIRPFLGAFREALVDKVDQEKWRRRYCPVCGGMPDFAYLDTERGARWLVCSRCDAEWLFQRLECPYCGTEDQNSLAYFVSEERPYRLYVCSSCHRYIKAVDLRKASAEVIIPLERLLTLDMDRQALAMGYRPPG
jgi:transcription elongation factor Elf1